MVLNIEDVQNVVSAAVGGAEAGQVFEGNSKIRNSRPLF